MSNEKKSRGKYWVFAAICAVAITVITLYRPEAFWLPLPPLATSIALAFDWL